MKASEAEKVDPRDAAFELISGSKLFQDPSGVAYIRFDREGEGGLTFSIVGERFSRYFRGVFFRHHQRLLTVQHFEVVRANLLAQAASQSDTVALRTARKGNTIYVDLANHEGEVLEIFPERLRTNARSEINFIRPPGMKPLPKPSISRCTLTSLLEQTLPQLGERQVVTLAAFLVGSMNPAGPYMHLQLSGLQGSGKSTLLRMLKRLLDPATLEGRSLPQSERDLLIAAQNSRLLCFDNVSKIAQWLSDALCRIATGGGIGTRELFSNDGEIVFDAMRPVVLNGIGDFVTRGDLKQRMLVMTLPEVRERLTETDIWAAFDKLYPTLLGALVKCVQAALSNTSRPPRADLPRMADWYEFVWRALPVIGFSEEQLKELVRDNRSEGSLSVLEASPVAQALIEYLKTHKEVRGTATELWSILRVRQEYVCAAGNWPVDGRTFSTELSRVESELPLAGIVVDRSQRTRDKRLIVISRRPQVPD